MIFLYSFVEFSIQDFYHNHWTAHKRETPNTSCTPSLSIRAQSCAANSSNQYNLLKYMPKPCYLPEHAPCTYVYTEQSTMSIRGCGLYLAGTHRVQECLLTQSAILYLYAAPLAITSLGITCFPFTIRPLTVIKGISLDALSFMQKKTYYDNRTQMLPFYAKTTYDHRSS